MSYIGRCAAVSQVMSTLAELVRSQIARSNIIKCVVAEDGIHSDMFQCSAHLLRNLDIEHPVYNVINSVVQSHHTAHGNCCKTLLIMAGLWYQEMEQLIELGLCIGEIRMAFEKGLEESVDHLLHSSAVRHLNTDLSESSYGYSASFKDDPEEVSSHPEYEVSSVPLKSLVSGEEFGPCVINGKSLSEDEDVGWFFERPQLFDSCDSEITVYTECSNSNVAMDRGRLKDNLVCRAEKLNNTEVRSSYSDTAGLFQHLEIEDEFEDCFCDAISDLRESETTSNIHNSSHQALLTLNRSTGNSSTDICNENSTNLVLLDKSLSREVCKTQKVVDSNSKLTQESAVFSSQYGYTRDSTSCSGDCHVPSKNRTENFVDFENNVKYDLDGDRTEDCEDTNKFHTRHSDLVEKDVHAKSNTAFAEDNPMYPSCALTTYIHCANDACIVVKPDYPNMALDIASKELNCHPASEKIQAFHASSFNFSNKYSRHSLPVSSPEESLQHHAIRNSFRNEKDLFRSNATFCDAAVGSGNVQIMGCGNVQRTGCSNTQTIRCGNVQTVGWGNVQTVGNDTVHTIGCSNVQTMESSNVQTCQTVGFGNIKESDSFGLRSCFDHATAIYDVSHEDQERTIYQDKMFDNDVFEQRLILLGSKLSHGADDMMKLVVKMAYSQLRNSGSTSVELDLMHTCCVEGVAEDKTCVVDGLLIPITPDQIPIILGEHDDKKLRRALLLNGDLTATFCHQGYRKVTKVTSIRRTVSEVESRSEIWLKEVMKVIEQLDVGVLFVKGKVDENVLYRCFHRNVVVFEGVSYKALSAISLCINAPLNLYISDCTECCLAQGIELQPWMCEWVRVGESTKHLNYVSVNASSSSLLVQTAIVCHPVSSMTHLKEEQLLHSAHRLCSSLKSRKVLVAGGAAETVCALFLEQSADNVEKASSIESDLVVATVYRGISRGFKRFVDVVRNNVGDSADQMIYDDCDSKLEAWRNASGLVNLLLHCDMEIVANIVKPSQDLVIGYL